MNYAPRNGFGFPTMIYTQPEFTVQEVNAAGKVLAASMQDDWANWDIDQWNKYHAAVEVVNNWRGAHHYPLNTFAINLRGISKKTSPEALVAQRIKRLQSIGLKLILHPKMKFSQMQDLGGCRAILPDVLATKKVVEYYQVVSKIKHELAATDDYIANPKPSGYRGVHLIYKYFSDKNKAMYNGMKIEMQIRSQYQHAWATAVETTGMFSGQALKSSLGSEDWKRFFALMGSVIALREKTPLIPGTPQARAILIDELKQLVNSLQVSVRLREYSNAMNAMSNNTANAAFYLLQLDPAKGTLQITGFAHDAVDEASKRYAEAEEAAKKSKTGGDAVLVSVDSISALGKAYPNYFADTRLFLELMEQAIRGRSHVIHIPDTKIQPSLPFPVLS